MTGPQAARVLQQLHRAGTSGTAYGAHLRAAVDAFEQQVARDLAADRERLAAVARDWSVCDTDGL